MPSVVLTFFSLTARAELSVLWIDDNTIRVSGTGYTVVTNVVYTNSLGTCTNCVQISPEQMHAYKTEIISRCDNTDNYLDDIVGYSYDIQNAVQAIQNDISTFRKFGSSPLNNLNVQERSSFTSYVYSVENVQTRLDRQNKPFGNSSTGSDTRWASYNNGIYDYSNTYLLPQLDSVNSKCGDIQTSANSAKLYVSSIRSIVGSMSETACSCQGDGAGTCPAPGGGSSDCPCAEQLDAIKDYVEHIDDDFHVQLRNMSVVTNFIPRMDSYAKLVSGVLYQDGTIQLDDGESWTNVYFSGESEMYSYDKSNILQRIELILFGIAHSTTNFASDVISSTNYLDDVAAHNVTNQFNEFSSDSTNSFLFAKSRLQSKVDSIKSISAMFVFWGTAGSDSPFTLGYVPNLDGTNGGQYIEVGSGFLGSEVSRFRQLCRYGFQLIWATSFLFLIWLFYVRIFKYVLIFLKYAFEWINEAFAS